MIKRVLYHKNKKKRMRVIIMAKKQENKDAQAAKDETKRTSVKVKLSDFNVFNEIAQEKLAQGEYAKDALNKAWQEAIELYNEKNKHFLDFKIKRLQEMTSND